MTNRGPRLRDVAGLIAIVLATWMFPATAHAHLSSSGMGPVYDGILHLVLNPEDLVAVLGLALFAGQRGSTQGRRVLFLLPAAWLLGGLMGMTASSTSGSPFVSAAWLLLLGGLVAADVRFPSGATIVLAILLGLSHGWSNGSGMGEVNTAAVALVGLTATVFVLVALISALVVSLEAEWSRIAVRVSGSWIAASGLLMLGWAARLR